MNLTPLTTDLNAHQNLPDQPTATAQELKIAWDKPANDIKTYINNTLLPDVTSGVNSVLSDAKAYTDSAVGAISLTAENISYDNDTSGLTADDVQGAIDEVKTNADTLGAKVTSLEGNTAVDEVTISGGSGTTLTSQNVFTIGDMVFLQFSATTSISTGSTRAVCTLPEKLRPTSKKYVHGNATDSNRNFALFVDVTINTDGTVVFPNPSRNGAMMVNLVQVQGFYMKN